MEGYTIQEVFSAKAAMKQPKRVVLCGSTRFLQAFQEANLRETLAGNVVLTIGCDTKGDAGLGLTEQDKFNLDLLHLHKIDLADEMLILNVGGYIGTSTRRELLYGAELCKRIRFLEPEHLFTDVCTSCGWLARLTADEFWGLESSSLAPCGCSWLWLVRLDLVHQFEES